jgi:hypothetical protein
MALRNSNTKRYFRGSWATVAFVDDQLVSLKPGSQLTTIIIREKSGGFSVSCVIEELSAVSDESSGVLKFSDEHHNT